MLAFSSSPIDPCRRPPWLRRGQGEPGRRRVLDVLAGLVGPRARRGVRHRLEVIVRLAACAVLVSARSFAAIAEWAADSEQATRLELVITAAVPCESTIRRTPATP